MRIYKISLSIDELVDELPDKDAANIEQARILEAEYDNNTIDITIIANEKDNHEYSWCEPTVYDDGYFNYLKENYVNTI